MPDGAGKRGQPSGGAAGYNREIAETQALAPIRGDRGAGTHRHEIPALGLKPYRSAIVVLVAATNLAADLAGREFGGVDVPVRRIGDDRVLEPVEVARGNVLGSGSDHVGAGDRPGHGTRSGGARF